MNNSNYEEIRRVRTEMSNRSEDDVRQLISSINEQRPEYLSRIISPGNEAEQSSAPLLPVTRLSSDSSTSSD